MSITVAVTLRSLINTDIIDYINDFITQDYETMASEATENARMAAQIDDIEHLEHIVQYIDKNYRGQINTMQFNNLVCIMMDWVQCDEFINVYSCNYGHQPLSFNIKNWCMRFM